MGCIRLRGRSPTRGVLVRRHKVQVAPSWIESDPGMMARLWKREVFFRCPPKHEQQQKSVGCNRCRVPQLRVPAAETRPLRDLRKTGKEDDQQLPVLFWHGRICRDLKCSLGLEQALWNRCARANGAADNLRDFGRQGKKTANGGSGDASSTRDDPGPA